MTPHGLVQLRPRGDTLHPPAAAEAPPPELATLIRDIESLESVVSGWDDQHRNTVRALERALDALHREALLRLVRTLKSEPAAAELLKRALSDNVVYGVMRHHGLVRASLQERLEAALDSVRPALATHGGGVELVAMSPPDTVSVRLLGSCDGCAASGLTLREGVEKAIRDACPEITRIHELKGGAAARGGYISPFARASETGWLRAVPVAEVPENQVLPRVVAGRSLLFTRVGEALHCFENACAHLGLPLDGGTVSNGVLTCPHHEFQYALGTGECLTAPEVQLQTHAVRVTGDDVEVKLS